MLRRLRWTWLVIVTATACTSLVGVDEFTKVDDAGPIGVTDASGGDGTAGDGTSGDGTTVDTAVAPDSTSVPDTRPLDTAPACPTVQVLSTLKAPTDLALSGSALYWGLNCGRAQTCPTTGCPSGSTDVSALSLSCTTGIAAQGSSLFVAGVVTGVSQVWSCTLPGCTNPLQRALPASSDGPTGIRKLLADPTGLYLLNKLFGSGENHLLKVPAGGGAACKLGPLPAAETAPGLAVVGNRLYVAHGKDTTFSLGWFPIDCSGAASPINPYVAGRAGLTSIVAQGTTLYWAESVAIQKVVDPAGAATVSPVLLGTDSHPRALASDASGLYWVTASGIYSCPHTGCGAAPKRLACEGCVTDADGNTLVGLALDDSYVYMSCPGSQQVIRVAK